MSIEQHKALVRRYFEDAPYNPSPCDEIFALTFRSHTIQRASVTPQVTGSTPEGEKAVYEWLRTVWSADWRMTVDEPIAEDDRVMARWTFHGLHQGDLSGLPPTHAQVTYSGINIYDRFWLWQQLGILPDIKEAVARARERMLAE